MGKLDPRNLSGSEEGEGISVNCEDKQGSEKGELVGQEEENIR